MASESETPREQPKSLFVSCGTTVLVSAATIAFALYGPVAWMSSGPPPEVLQSPQLEIHRQQLEEWQHRHDLPRELRERCAQALASHRLSSMKRAVRAVIEWEVMQDVDPLKAIERMRKQNEEHSRKRRSK